MTGVRHDWDLGVSQATRLQNELRELVIDADSGAPVRWVAGADVSAGRQGSRMYAGVVVCDARTLEVVEIATACGEARFPYVPGYLSFREIPLLLKAFGRLGRRPDLVVCDGQGRAHPRRMGLACHLGLWLEVPTIGCAKTRLIGHYRMPGPRRRCHRRLVDRGEVVGEVVRTRGGVKPVFVSVGHRVSLPTARRWVLQLARPFRLPEPIRAAHHVVNELRRAAEQSG
ncbi:MAG: deoxyribonuclease V [Planctomycetota bacterium]|jgi:deoxyribonuclease V